MKGAVAVTDPQIIFRAEVPGDALAITDLIADAFGRPAEALLVSRLRAAQALAVSVVAEAAGQLVAHAALSPLEVDGQARAGRWLGLAPVAVLPWWQRGVRWWRQPAEPSATIPSSTHSSRPVWRAPALVAAAEAL